MAVEYRCEGCGVRVITLPVFQPPSHGFCVQRAFLCACVPDPVEMMAMRKALELIALCRRVADQARRDPAPA